MRNLSLKMLQSQKHRLPCLRKHLQYLIRQQVTSKLLVNFFAPFQLTCLPFLKQQCIVLRFLNLTSSSYSPLKILPIDFIENVKVLLHKFLQFLFLYHHIKTTMSLSESFCQHEYSTSDPIILLSVLPCPPAFSLLLQSL